MTNSNGRRALACSVLATWLLASGAHAQPGSTAVSPYFLVVVDTSGSMTTSTGPGNNSCGQDRSRLSDAKCVLSSVVDGFGDVSFGLERFRQSCRGSCSSSTCDDSCGCRCDETCNGTADAGEILVPIGTDNQSDILEWVDYTCATCRLGRGMQPELHAEGNTPLAGALRSARRYFAGGDPAFPTSPIAGDAYAGCRPMAVILLTDGQETCTSASEARTAATELRATSFGGATYDIRTYVIGFGISPGSSGTEDIATAGGTDAPGTHRAFYATDETSLALAFSQIVSDSILQETCNGADDDCDARVDEGYTLYCDRPGGTSSASLCLDPGERVCDGLDDNCNGAIDEGLRNACGGCGATPAEVCNRTDDDCDGAIDEGACGGCVPMSEICDGLNNDCDGAIDEGLVRPCGTDVGECSAGTQACTAGSWGTCSGVGPVSETCNGRDDDCDGLVDGMSRPCGSDVGACQAGAQLCTSGAWGTCVGGIGPIAEACNADDDDCDGSVDEGNPGGGASCGTDVGACAPGALTCSLGVLVCTGATGPSGETCNAADDDCDGSVDESVPTAGTCGSAVGECRLGARTCVSGTFTCTGDRGPTSEVCDARDNDCDGSVDEGNPGGGASCGTDVGVCALGTTRCVGGTLACTGGSSPMPETCDGDDEDCDGLVDEGNPGGGASCGATDTGECELGALACVSGALACVGETGPSAERCNGLDDDCDGTIDEGDPEGGGACGSDTGECTAGTDHCVSGMLTCVGGVGPATEICNGLDDDCDGVIDDGIAVGAPCGSDTGECAPGRNVCRDGALVCEGAIDPIDEVCNALDDDCDGSVDEGLADGGPCGTDEGVCMVGRLRCIGGRSICEGAVPAGRESCDCEDDDCDGAVDEMSDTLCPSGSACVECQCALPCAATELGFVCPNGRYASEQPDGTCFCVAERCDDDACAEMQIERGDEVRCAPGSSDVASCVCRDNACTFACDGVTCGDGLVCDPRDPYGRCVEDSCRGLGCPEGQLCDARTGECREDRCASAECAEDQACRDGACETSCADVECPSGQRCARGECVDDPCAGVSCDEGEVCSDGACVRDRCEAVHCPRGTLCEPATGACADDPCALLHCPSAEECVDGECAHAGGGLDAGTAPMDAGTRGSWVYAAGHEGCSAAPGASHGPPLWIALALLALAWRRVR